METTTMKPSKHNPWDRMSAADRQAQLELNGGHRPMKWTLDLDKVGTVDEDGYVYVYAGGPVADGVTNKVPRKRADGKIDGRSKGQRKCGKCGETGHNARTCGRKQVKQGPVELPASLKKPVPTHSEILATPPQPERREPPVVHVPGAKIPLPKITPSGEAPPPKSVATRAGTKMKGAKSTRKQKTCGKCGQKGHNARTCGKSKPKGVKKARKRQNTCGRCGKLGHNARTCEG